MESAGHFVSPAAELAAGMENGEYDFHGRKSRFMVDADRDPAPVVAYGNGIILIDIYLYLIAISGKRLVNGVVHDLIDQMMKTSG